MWGGNFFGPEAKPNWSFGEADNEYAHSPPESFILMGDLETFRRMLSNAQIDDADGIVATMTELESAFNAVQAAVAKARGDRDGVGTAKGALQPFTRPAHAKTTASWCAATIKKIRTQNEREHAYGVALLEARLHRELVKAATGRLLEASEKALAAVALIKPDEVTLFASPGRDHIRLMCMNNVMCARSLLKSAEAFSGLLVPFSETEAYGPMTRWISLQWARFLRDRKGPRTSGGGVTIID